MDLLFLIVLILHIFMVIEIRITLIFSMYSINLADIQLICVLSLNVGQVYPMLYVHFKLNCNRI